MMRAMLSALVLVTLPTAHELRSAGCTRPS
jgi:hypothetical protein